LQLWDRPTSRDEIGPDARSGTPEDSLDELLILLGGGLLAGFLGGLLGLGGGIVLMPLLRFGIGLSPAHAAGTCVLAVFFTTLGGSYRHLRLGHVQLEPIMPVILAGGVASVAASLAFPHLAVRGRWLDLGIGLVFSLIAMRMLAEGMPGLPWPRAGVPARDGMAGPPLAKVGIGAAAGSLPGLLGIGTGGILVPAFTFLLRAPIKAAIGASLVCFSLNALISCAFKLGQGYIDLGLALPACLGTLVGANLGALLNRRFPPRGLKLAFGAVFGCVALRFILVFLGEGA
jgi:uncharacterized membrane protein YfcA